MRTFNVESDLTDVMRALFLPSRAHEYIIAYTGGAQKSIIGHFQCYEVDHTRLGGSMSYLRHQAKHQYVYCMLSGQMTSNQKVLAQKNVELILCFTMKYQNGSFKNQIILASKAFLYLTSVRSLLSSLTKKHETIPIDKETEESFGGGSYVFSSAQDPKPKNSV